MTGLGKDEIGDPVRLEGGGDRFITFAKEGNLRVFESLEGIDAVVEGDRTKGFMIRARIEGVAADMPRHEMVFRFGLPVSRFPGFEGDHAARGKEFVIVGQ